MILDVCCGKKSMYGDLLSSFGNSEIIFVDLRKGFYAFPKASVEHESAEGIEVLPDVKADLKVLPFRDSTFKLILFDPPHGDFSLTSFMNVKYGSLSLDDYKAMLVKANEEFFRVLESEGLLLVKTISLEHREVMTEHFLTNFKSLLELRLRSGAKQRSNSMPVCWMLMVCKKV